MVSAKNIDYHSIKMLIKKILSIIFFHFDIHLAQEQEKNFKLNSNDVHGFKHPLRVFEVEKTMKFFIMARKINYYL